MIIKSAKFIISSPDVKDCPEADIPEYAVSRTNRFAVINGGKYIIPVIAHYNPPCIRYGKIGYPLTDYSGEHSYLYILVKDWEIVEHYQSLYH